jgi:hypothetical protein
MTRSKRLISFACLLCLLAPGLVSANTVYRASPQLPLDSWVYPALERVVSLSRVDSGLAGLRPLTRLEAARLTLKATLKERIYAVPLKAKLLLRRLQKELSDELAYLQESGGQLDKVKARPVRSLALAYSYRDGQDAGYVGNAAHQPPLIYNRDGRRYAANSNAEFSLLGDLSLFDRLLFSWRPLLSYAEDDELKLDLLSGVVALNLNGIELSVGRQSLAWGPGRHGSLLLTNNAEPLDMVRLTNPSPHILPWLFKYLGPIRFDLFVSELDDDRVVAEPYFGGLRLDFKPFRWLELGAARTVMFGGEGRPGVDGSDFLTIIGGQNLSGNEDTSNSIAGIDARIIFAQLGGAELYGELYGEDEAGMLMTKNSWLAGLNLPQVDPAGYLSLRVEYADTTQIGSSVPVLYRHGIYRSGYIYEGQIMGHHVGGDATDLSADLRLDLSERLTLGLLLDLEERGKSQVQQEEHRQAQLKADYWVTPQLLLKALYAYDDVNNWNFSDGGEEQNFVNLGLEYVW